MNIEVDGREFEIRKPTYKQLTEAQLYSSKIFNEAVKNGVTLRVNLEEELRKNGAWSEDKAKRLVDVTLEINNLIDGLTKGKGVYKKLSEARKTAIQVRRLRNEQTELLLENRKLDNYTAEGLAEQARFDYLVSVCVYHHGEKVFSNINEYLEKADQDWAKKCATEVMYMLHPDTDRDWQLKLPENKFLKKYDLIDDQGRLVDKDGHLVDEQFNQLDLPEVEEEYEELENDLWQTN